MANTKLNIKCTVPLWLRLYIKALRFFAETFGRQVDLEKLARLLNKHVKTEVVK